MAWVKLDDHFPEHPKVAALDEFTPLCGWLYVCGLAWCNRHLTDGFIPAGIVGRLASFDRLAFHVDGHLSPSDVVTTESVIAELVMAGLWEEAEGGYQVHDYLDYQPSRRSSERVSKVRSKVGRKGAAQKWVKGDGKPHGKPDGKVHGKRLASSMASEMAKTCPDPDPDPDPERHKNGGAPPPLDPDVAAMPWTAGTPGSARRGRQAFEWRACVPEALHAEFRRKLGGSEQEADERLRAWYRAVSDDWPDLPIGESDWVFWRARFAEWVGVTATAPRTTAALMPSYDPDWCRHEPRCASRDWHDLMVAREAKAEVTT